MPKVHPTKDSGPWIVVPDDYPEESTDPSGFEIILEEDDPLVAHKPTILIVPRKGI